MTLGEIKYQVLYQTNNDEDDIGDFEPHLNDYINDGYDRLVKVWDNAHVKFNAELYARLDEDTDVPETPEWTHRYLADWATWLVYRNGNPSRQNRGYPFRESFERMLSQVALEGGAKGVNEDGSLKKYRYFRNIPN